MNQKLKSIRLTSTFSLIILVLMPMVMTSVIGYIENSEDKYSIKEDFPKVHRGFLFTNGDLGGLAETDTYHMKLKAGKEYYFRALADYQYGLSISLSIVCNDIIDGKLEFGSWDNGDPKSMRKIIFTFTPSSENYTLLIIKADFFNVEDFKYEIYVNLAGFAGYWWMLLCGFFVLVIVLLITVSMARKSKKSKRKKSKSKKRR
ncbi:MAG TPA: hypothetical protein VMZ29_04915 [Candidatus Bathyarchaeia archaeon]|nr:hypothetical protein [Candidatus Bathyarchaeia archaeon]